MTEKDDAKAEFEARRGFWNGSVYFDGDDKHPWHKGHCDNCGLAVDWRGDTYTDVDTGYLLCWPCFRIYERFHNVMRNYVPAIYDNGGEWKFFEWKGYEDFIRRNPLPEGYHYSLCVDRARDYHTHRDYRFGHLMVYNHDQSEGHAEWVVKNDTIIDEWFENGVEKK